MFEAAQDELANPTAGELDSTYDHLICIGKDTFDRDVTTLRLNFVAKQAFAAPPLLIHLLDLCRAPLKNTVDTFVSHFIENRVDDILHDEDNILTVIQALQGKSSSIKTIDPHFFLR